ncbi:MAG: Crp/Fnr family transcriptional regulator [Pseudomonadota bacterium]|jgi:CRP/FNR family transcriptional regulator|uniref:CRP/FNR family transcriptional regulator, anaerobic regulatory protein n=1 Tax=Thalassococcus halodurans TaxID=373675 RepID=A0A1H5ZRL5_9RHOB|nr:Crp/Fnr family transcriptional regulator [Thalassococcus halodurans]MEC8582579.1 Crp/Fnr family transcriptional regulator [Pseudomonadota bacterium]SEG38405.1 CRP/FNR family transcriptional regulator, anaerobic regulatory protein [Thalassococcus halodurans]
MNTAKIEFSECGDCPIRHRAVCSRCETDELEQLNKIKFYKSYPAGQTIAIRGEPLQNVASIVAGTATLTRSIEDGRTQMVGLLLPSDFIGRPGRDTLQYDVTAVSDVTLCCFQRKPFEKLLEDLPHVRERLLEMALDELDAARDWMLLLGRKTARERIASLLTLMVKRTIRPDGEVMGNSSRIELPITREAMANYLGLTIETVSRQLTKLKNDGIIGIEGKRAITIPDLGALLAETGDDEDGGMIV